MLNAPSMFNEPSVAHNSKVDSTYIQPTLNHGLRIWWAYYWPTNIIVGLLTFCEIFWLRILYQRAAITAQTFRIWMMVWPYAITAAVGLLIFRYILGKRFRHFRMALLPAGNLGGPPLRPIWRRTIRVWWTFTWRTIIYGIIFSFLANVSLGIFLGMLRETSRFAAISIPLVEGLLIAAAVGLFVMYSNVLDEEFADFRVVLLPREAPAQTPMAADLPPQTQATA